MKRKTTKKVTVLNTQVLRAINAIPVRVASQHDSMVHVLDILYRLAYKQNAVPGVYIPIPRNFWKKAVGCHYERPINLLRNYGIVQCLDSYSNFEGNAYCKSYRIRPNLIDEEVEYVTYNVSNKEGDKHTTEKDNSAVAKYTRRILRMVKLDTRAVKKDAASYVEQRKFISKLQVDGEIFGNGSISPDCTNVPKWKQDLTPIPIKIAIEKAKRYGCSLIKDKNRYIVDSVESYVKRKADQITRAYAYTIAQLQNRTIYANRNETNNRLDSNITSFPTTLLRHLSIDGQQFVSIDLSNSQMIILASIIEQSYNKVASAIKVTKTLHDLTSQGILSLSTVTSTTINTKHYHLTKYYQWITQNHTITRQALTFMCAKSVANAATKTDENTLIPSNMETFPPDLQLFVELTKSGKIYDFIRENLNVPTRMAAKTLAFEIFFADYKFHGYAKQELKKIFPTLIKIIDDYKKRAHDSNEFAIMLQKRESVIFIDRIMPRLMAKGYKVLSKHDSILCLSADVTEVEKEMRVVLDEELGQYELKITQADGTPIHATPKNDRVTRSVTHDNLKGTLIESSWQNEQTLPNRIRTRQE